MLISNSSPNSFEQQNASTQKKSNKRHAENQSGILFMRIHLNNLLNIPVKFIHLRIVKYLSSHSLRARSVLTREEHSIEKGREGKVRKDEDDGISTAFVWCEPFLGWRIIRKAGLFCNSSKQQQQQLERKLVGHVFLHSYSPAFGSCSFWAFMQNYTKRHQICIYEWMRMRRTIRTMEKQECRNPRKRHRDNEKEITPTTLKSMHFISSIRLSRGAFLEGWWCDFCGTGFFAPPVKEKVCLPSCLCVTIVF